MEPPHRLFPVGLEPRDPPTLIGAAMVPSAVGGVAGLPAWRASLIEPAEVLRAE